MERGRLRQQHGPDRPGYRSLGMGIDLSLTEENRLVQSTVRGFTAKEIEPHIREWDSNHELHPEIFSRMGELGFLTPDEAFIDLNQGDVRPQEMVDQQSREGTADGSSVVAGKTWQRLISPDGRTRSLVLVGSDSTVVVTADLPYEALEAYASTLSSA